MKIFIRNLCVLTLILMAATAGKAQGFSQKERSMELIELKGSYFEIGEQWGKSFGPEINAFMDMEIGGLAQYFQLKSEDVIAMALKFETSAQEYDPDFIEVLKGFSKGANVSFEKLFAVRCLLELTFFFHKIPQMCSGFCVTGSATVNGATLIGQNIDWHPGIPMKMLKITWPNGVNQLSLSVGGIWEYTLSSFSDSVPYGVVNTSTVAMRDDQNLDKPPLSFVMNKASRQKRMEGALGVFVQAKKDLASFLLASAEGDMVGFECVADDVEVHYPEQNTLVRTNHYLTDRFKSDEFFAGYVSDTYLRYARLKRLVQENHGNLTLKKMMAFLSDHNGYPHSVCTHVDPESQMPPAATIASVIMVPQKKEMYVAFGNPCETEYIRYSMD